MDLQLILLDPLGYFSLSEIWGGPAEIISYFVDATLPASSNLSSGCRQTFVALPRCHFVPRDPSISPHVALILLIFYLVTQNKLELLQEDSLVYRSQIKAAGNKREQEIKSILCTLLLLN